MEKPIMRVEGKDIYKIKGEPSRKIALAYWGESDEWITWAISDDFKDVFYGHYFETREEAEEDFETRSR